MKPVKFIIIVLLTLSLNPLFSQSTEQHIADIRSEFKRINTVANLQTKELNNEEFLDQMTDGGGTLTGYFENDQLVKFTIWVGLSVGTSESEYYFKDGILFFLYQRENRFGQKADGEAGDRDYSELETIFEGRYYLNDGEMIKRLEEGERFFSRSFEIDRTIEYAYKNAALLKEEN